MLLPFLLGANQLANHPSPYLALHADDPVDWQVWSAKTLENARKNNKLLFISVGYFACHWCHVMQRESFSNSSIAKRLNKHFIPVKVDRELNPVLDNRLMTFLQASTGRGGWPMNIIMTPDGYPLLGMIYLPPEQFGSVLDQVSEKWKRDKSTLSSAAKEVDALIATQLKQGEVLRKEISIAALAPQFLESAMEQADQLGGGFGNGAKFPSLPQLSAMLEINHVINDAAARGYIENTLVKMHQSGLHDEIGYGFFRYTVDPDWQTPHFEKMLYTNTQMASLYARAGELLQRDDFKLVAENTLTFMLESLLAGNGAMITSLSALDDKDREGGYYLWQADELKKLLDDEEMKLVNKLWGLDRVAEFEAGSLPIRNDQQGEVLKEDKIAAVRKKLKLHREQSRKLPRDDKQLASLNGYALAIFAQVSGSDRKYRQPSGRIADYLKQLWIDRKLVKGLDRDGNSLGAGTLADYAAVAYGLLSWHEVSEDARSYEVGKAILLQAWDKFHHDQGWQPLEKSLLPNPLYQRHIQDSAEPSPETMILLASQKVLAQEKNPLLEKKLKMVISQVSQGLLDSPFHYASVIAFASGLEKAQPPPDISGK